MPKRNRTTRIPFSSAGREAASHWRQTSDRKSLPEAAVFVEQFVSAVPVETDGRGGHQRGRRLGEVGQSVAQQGRSPDTAVADPGFLRRRPAPGGDVLARQVHDRLDSLKPTAVQFSPVSGFHCTVESPGPDGADGRRTSLMTSCPADLSTGNRAEPTSPVEPETRIFMVILLNSLGRLPRSVPLAR